jgi:myo-inositol-1(or 4)-monophosphatase
MTGNVFKQTLLECVRAAGSVLLKQFGKIAEPRLKENPSNIVCAADREAEASIIGRIRARFPDHAIIAEESGYSEGASDFVWVVDPLDGTSNYVAGIPWFGVQIGLLRSWCPVMASIYLPTEDALYFAESGCGTFRNGRRIRVSGERRINNILCSFGMDGTSDLRANLENARLLAKVSSAVRNVRSTNSVIDFCYTVEGRLGACINLNTKIWDIVPVSLMLPEAGGKLTDVNGGRISFCVNPGNFHRDYAVIGASVSLHRQLLSVTKRRRA